MQIRVTRKQRAKLPLIRVPKQVLDDIAVVAQGAIIDNILQQRTADGAKLKTNAPATRERKRRQGKPLLSLIDSLHRFIKGGQGSWAILRYLPGNRGVVVGPATDELRQLIRWVGQRGYTGFIGLRPKHRAAIGKVVRNWLQSLVRKPGTSGVQGGGGRTVRGDL